MNILWRWLKKKQYYVQCIECGIEITGATENHCTHNFLRHFKTKHPGLNYPRKEK